MTQERRTADLWAIRLVEKLHGDLLSRAGRVKEVNEKAGVNPNYSRQGLRNGTMDLARFCRLVEASGSELLPFVTEALEGSFELDGEAVSLVSSPGGDLPKVVSKAIDRFYDAKEGSIPRSHLEAMDDLRFDSPQKAIAGVEAVIDFLAPEDVPFALGVYASSCRALLRIRDAWSAISAALEISQAFEHLASRADLWRRVSVLHLVNCAYEKALASSERASASYLRLGSLHGVGQTLVDQGTILWETQRLDEAEAAFRQGLALLAPSDARHQRAGRHNLAVLLRTRGKSTAALEALATEVPPSGSKVETGKLEWLQGLCLADLGRVEEALEAFDRALERLMKPLPADAAQLICDQVRFMIEWGMLREGLERARSMRGLIIPLEERSPRIAAAVRDLVAAEIESNREIALKLVVDAQERIRRARQREPAGPDPSALSNRRDRS